MQWCFEAALQIPVDLSLNNQPHLQQLVWPPLQTAQTEEAQLTQLLRNKGVSRGFMPKIILSLNYVLIVLLICWE